MAILLIVLGWIIYKNSDDPHGQEFAEMTFTVGISIIFIIVIYTF
jgi:hypothetical protein